MWKHSVMFGTLNQKVLFNLLMSTTYNKISLKLLTEHNKNKNKNKPWGCWKHMEDKYISLFMVQWKLGNVKHVRFYQEQKRTRCQKHNTQTLGSSSSSHNASHEWLDSLWEDKRANNGNNASSPKTITAAIKQAKESRAYKSYNTPENL